LAGNGFTPSMQRNGTPARSKRLAVERSRPFSMRWDIDHVAKATGDVSDGTSGTHNVS
jgi:hypothetical protein